MNVVFACSASDVIAKVVDGSAKNFVVEYSIDVDQIERTINQVSLLLEVTISQAETN